MPVFRPTTSAFTTVESHGKPVTVLRKEEFEKFNPNILGLGDIRQRGVAYDALSAVFDLAGFTHFCTQIEPHLAVPRYLSEFLSWLMEQLRRETVMDDLDTGVRLWHPLPFFVKFMGDGLLLLWDTDSMDQITARNVVVSLREICGLYATTFFPTINRRVVDPPSQLRCGLARGTVFSVGNGEDFVGSCINMASRLQKLPGLGFAFNIRGIDVNDPDADSFFRTEVLIKRVSIRGIGDNELIGCLAADFDTLAPNDKGFYRNP
jgi:class 3 adenylate cyclase